MKEHVHIQFTHLTMPRAHNNRINISMKTTETKQNRKIIP